jgi:ribonucleoside-diphosphate reductase alpha chain
MISTPAPKTKVNGNGHSPKAEVTHKPVTLTDNARTVLQKRYLRRGDDGKPVETIEEMFWRVANHVAQAENEHGGDSQAMAEKFYDLLTSLEFFPNSPTFTGAGTPLGQLAACFVLKIEDDMGRSESGIFQTLRDAALIQQTGGGNGFGFGRLRPQKSLVKTSAGEATGPVGFLRVYDKAFGEIAQGGTRRGANMAVLPVDHPDIEDFVTCKTDENSITNFNISVGITDKFMQAVKQDDWWDLRFPDVKSPLYRSFSGTMNQAEKAGIPTLVYKRVRARDLFDKIVKQAHHNGEPGVLFLDAANRENPVPHLYELEATNPCGEQFLGPFENCCLGSINLGQHKGADGAVDWEKLRQSTITATRFLDDVVTANAYVPAVPQLKKAGHNARRIGLGIMGLGDLMYHCGIRYGSEEAQEFSAQIMEFVRYTCMLTSVDLAEERGSFTAFEGSLYDTKNFAWAAPTPLEPYTRNYGRPAVDWDKVVNGIKKHGIRNACQTTVAPTGTIATVAGCESYGCEPVFALAYIRHVNDNGRDLQLTYTSPMFEKALIEAGIDEATRAKIVEEVMAQGSCQNVDEVPEHIRHAFVVSQDISAEEHVRMQASIQRFVDNSLSKTCNFGEGATEEDVAHAYMLAWELGCKGLTVYVTGSRQKVVLETHATAKAKEVTAEPVAVVAAPAATPQPVPMFHETKKPRPNILHGETLQITSPVGKSYVTINRNGGEEPFEVFINTGKAGSEVFAVSEAIGRLISYTLRLASPVAPRERLAELARQLNGIGGGRSMGFGPNRVLSLPDAVGRALGDYLTLETSHLQPMPANGNGHNHAEPEAVEAPQSTQPAPGQLMMKIGDICPSCGEAALVNEEGCRKCYACGHSEC